MNFIGSNTGCGCKCPTAQPTYEQCKQIVQTCNVEEIPHYINYHTHIVNNHVKKHINVPTYSMSEENIILNEYPIAQVAPIPYMPYQTGTCGQTTMPYQQQMVQGQMAQYQGNVGTEPMPFQTPTQAPYNYGLPQYPGMNIPFGY